MPGAKPRRPRQGFAGLRCVAHPGYHEQFWAARLIVKDPPAHDHSWPDPSRSPGRAVGGVARRPPPADRHHDRATPASPRSTGSDLASRLSTAGPASSSRPTPTSTADQGCCIFGYSGIRGGPTQCARQLAELHPAHINARRRITEYSISPRAPHSCATSGPPCPRTHRWILVIYARSRPGTPAVCCLTSCG